MTRKEKRIAVYNKFDGRCAYCGCLLNGKFHVDHITPKIEFERDWIKSRNIDLALIDDISNLNPSCRSCNTYKSHFSIEEFRNNIHDQIRQQRRRPTFRIAERFGMVSCNENHKVTFYFEIANG